MASIADALTSRLGALRRPSGSSIAVSNSAVMSIVTSGREGSRSDDEEGVPPRSTDIEGWRFRLEPAELAEPSHWATLGAALQEAGRYREARTAFREALRMAPGDIDIVLGLAHLDMECGRYQHACDMFQIVIDSLPTRADVAVRAARACFELGKTKRAKSIIEDWKSWPMDERLTVELAALMIEVGRMREGLSVLKKVPDLSRVGTYALAWLASALAQTTHVKKARHCLGLLPSPDDVPNPALREEILTACARVALQCGNLFGARRFLEFLDTPPAPGLCRSSKPYFLLAEICFRQLDMEAAKSAMLTGHCMRMKAADIASPLLIEFS